jgi:uncharacterized protein (DUF342 family)
MGYARITVMVAADGLSASARVFSGPPMGEAEIREALESAGVVFGVRQDAVERLAAELTDELFTVSAFVLAEGAYAEPGKDGYFVPAFVAGIQPGHVREDGTMDFLDRELLKPVAQGTVLGHLHKASAGQTGRRVDGSEQPIAKTREFQLRLGPGAALEANGDVTATRAGVLLFSGRDSIDVVQHHVHTGKVDLRSGHLDMEGSLVVKGSVERLFRAAASGDVEIQGGVEYGSVQAGGSLRVSGGVRGGETGMVSAEGDVSVRQAEYAQIVCGGLLKLESAINCELVARDIQITGKLRGGKARAERSVVAREAGVAQGVATELTSALPIERPVLAAKRSVASAKDQRQLVHKSARNDERGKGGKAGRATATLQSADLVRKVELAQRRDALLPDAFVEVSGTVHPGVTIQIGTATLTVDQADQGVRFSFDFLTRKIRTERFVR